MPQSSDELRALMNEWFGDPISDEGPSNLLLSHGWTEKAGLWMKPTESYTISDIEWYCVKFLIEEWDYDIQRQSFTYISKHTRAHHATS